MTPAEAAVKAAELFDKRAREATPGPWRRPLNTRYKNSVLAPLPEGERGRYLSGRNPDGSREEVGVVQCNTWSNGAHARKRSGRDLEWVALADPRLGPPLAGLLREKAAEAALRDTPREQAETLGWYWLRIAYDAAGVPEGDRVDLTEATEGGT